MRRRGARRPVRRPTITRQFALTPAAAMPPIDMAWIESAALGLIGGMGIACALPSDAAACCRDAGMSFENGRLTIPEDVARRLLMLAPRRFTHVARNPEHSLEISPSLTAFGPTLDARHVWSGAARGALRMQDAAAIEAIAASNPVLGYGAGPLCLNAVDGTPVERLRGFLSDGRPALAAARAPFAAGTLIGAALAATRAVPTPDGASCSLLLIATVDAALTFDAGFLDAVIALSAAEEGVVIAPTLLLGANAPATRDGLLLRFAAETLAGVALAQALCPGMPVALGATITDVSLRNGLPLPGTVDAIAALGACIALARHWGLAFFSLGPATSAKGFNALATAETARWLTAAHYLGANVIAGAIGAVDLDDGVSIEKLVVDLEVATHITMPSHAATGDPAAEVASIGSGGNFLASPMTQARARSMADSPLAGNEFYESWTASGSPTLQQRLDALTTSASKDVEARQIQGSSNVSSPLDEAAFLAAIEDAEPRTIDNPGLADLASGIYSRALRDAFGFKG